MAANLEKIRRDGRWADIASTVEQNFDKLNVALTNVENSTTNNKGYFSTSGQLVKAFPVGKQNWIAYVGTSYPYQIWKWDGTAWVDTAQTGGAESVNLGDYYTKQEVDAAEAARVQVIKSVNDITI